MIQPKILLVEDDDALGPMLAEYLSMKGFNVDHAVNGREGLKKFKDNNYDLCILDVMMPEMDGFSLAKKVKNQDVNVPIIFLTARSLKIDVLKGFNLGADDYIKKPVDEEELVARIQAVLHRSQKPPVLTDDVYEVGTFTFDLANQRLTNKVDDQTRYLTEMEAHLLKLLCEYKENLLPREYVLKTIWGKSDYFTRRSMDVFISKLRKYLSGDDSISITNVHGSGFILSDQPK